MRFLSALLFVGFIVIIIGYSVGNETATKLLTTGMNIYTILIFLAILIVVLRAWFSK